MKKTIDSGVMFFDSAALKAAMDARRVAPNTPTRETEMKGTAETPASKKSSNHARLGVVLGIAAWIWFWFFMDATTSGLFRISLYSIFTNEELMKLYGVTAGLETGFHFEALVILMVLTAGVALGAGALIGYWIKK